MCGKRAATNGRGMYIRTVLNQLILQCQFSVSGLAEVIGLFYFACSLWLCMGSMSILCHCVSVRLNLCLCPIHSLVLPLHPLTKYPHRVTSLRHSHGYAALHCPIPAPRCFLARPVSPRVLLPPTLAPSPFKAHRTPEISFARTFCSTPRQGRENAVRTAHTWSLASSVPPPPT